MNEEFLMALEEIERDRGVSREVILDSIRTALISSYKKNFNAAGNVDIDVEISDLTDKIRVFQRKVVREVIEDEDAQITPEEAALYLQDPKDGDVVRMEITPKNFGRIAAQTAKQVVIQKIKDAERDIIYSEYIDRENELITGQINRIRRGSCYVDLGRLEGILPPLEQIPGERYNVGDRLKMLILEVKRTGKGPQIVLSRSHPNLVRKLFELEVPEIAEGVVEIYQTAREAGSRTKIAIFSRDPQVDALGACVGFQGARVKSIVEELGGEKIDIIIWSSDIREFIRNALAPSGVTEVFVRSQDKSSVVFVPEDQLSLAIGKEGQNARLAARLTNWKIDIKSDRELDHFDEEAFLQERRIKMSSDLDEWEVDRERAEPPLEDAKEACDDLGLQEELLQQLREVSLDM